MKGLTVFHDERARNTRRAPRPASLLASLLVLAVAALGLAPLAHAEQPLATPSSVTVTRADGTLTATWPAVDGATGYHITYSSNGRQSWSLAAYDHPTASITIDDVSNTATYYVAVRALSATGNSGWRNSAPSAPFTPPPPATPSSVAVLRADGTLTATWPAVDGATGYHVTYSSNGRQSWSLAAYDHPTASITIDDVSNTATYYVAVRALNATGGSGWRNSAPSAPFTPPPPATPSSVAVLRADGTLTATWPAVQGATGYHVTYSSNGRQSWSLAAYDHPSASITVDNVTNSATYYVAVRALNVSGGSGWRNSPAVGPWESPGTPENLTVEPGKGYLDIAWDAVSGATGYDVRAKAEGSTAWHSVAANIAETSHRYTTTTTLDHIAVRARNAGNAGPWAEISRMPSEDFWTAYDAQTVGGSSLGGGGGYAFAEALAQPASNKLGKVTWGTITRTTREHHAVFSVQWTPVTGADGYNFVCSEYSGWHWDLCGWGVSNHNTTISYATVPTSQLQPLSITHHWRKDGPNTPGKYTLGAHRHIMLAVRAVKNNDPSAAGPWAQTEEIPPFLPGIWGFSHTRGDGQISMAWNAKPHVTGYNVYCAVAVPGASGDYTLCATLTDQVWTLGGRVSVTVSDWTADGTSYSIDNTKKYDFAIVSTNKWSAGRWLPPLMDPITLTSSKIGETTATLTLAEYTGSWWLKSTAAGSTCESMGTATTKNAIGLTPGRSYTYTAYSDSACTNAIVSATAFTTLSVPSVSNLTATAHSTGTAVYSNNHSAAKFTTGSSANGYTLQRATVKIDSVGSSPGDLTVAVHASSSGSPASAATYTLSGTNPAGAGEATFACPTNTTCSLTAGTDYFLVLKGTGASSSNGYTWDTTASDSETNDPSNFGWSIANTGKRYSSSSWADETGGRTGLFKVSATIDPVLTVTGVSGSGATLNIAHHGVASWYYKATTGPHTACQGPVTASTKALTGLSAATSYTYSAYSDSTCTSANRLATAAAFTTTLPAPSGLSLSFNSGALKMQASWNKPSGATGAVGYELQHADSDRNNPYGSTTTIAATSASTVTHQFNNSLTIKFRVRAVVGSTKSAWKEHVS